MAKPNISHIFFAQPDLFCRKFGSSISAVSRARVNLVDGQKTVGKYKAVNCNEHDWKCVELHRSKALHTNIYTHICT